ncbi:DUF350 domain-containing protein [Tistrella mobilis]|uniref:DUF350 domain-containing protein n=1 Tax=Tistrella mobilis TaxID=171437 RepID=A0A162L656_9PROT|nr:DUF350 domain-containing protein [Tistrella mobilis]KYO53479.1 hypothetical protein AUP44_03800 [Tistrella mobilis]
MQPTDMFFDYTLAALPDYLGFLGIMAALIAVFTAIYQAITPYREIRLIRAGNRAAAISLSGTIIGLAIALNTVAAGAVSILDMALWGAIACISQLVVYLIVARLLGDLSAGIEEDRIGYGILLGGVSVATGLVNAGALTY